MGYRNERAVARVLGRRLHGREAHVCPNCNYIGRPELCSCMWTIRKVAEGRGNDPDVVRNAKTILSMIPDESGERT